MRLLIIFYIILFTKEVINAQNVENGIYINKERNEFLCIHNDSIQFRLLNNDCLNTYSIAKGKYKIKKSGKIHIFYENSILEQTSVIKQVPRNDSLVKIKAFYNDSTPIAFAIVFIAKAKTHKNRLIEFFDKKGELTLDKETVHKFINKNILISISTPTLYTKKKIFLKTGYDYVIQLTMPQKYPFIIFKKENIIVKKLNNKEIEVIRKYRRKLTKTKLTKIDANNIDVKCHQFLFNKDVKYFLSL